MGVKPTPNKDVLKETAEDLVEVLGTKIYAKQEHIKSLQAEIEQLERKVRWLKKEILD